jgi:hypothetical protein
MSKELTFENLPTAVSQILDDLVEIKKALHNSLHNNQDESRPKWFSLDEVIQYDPAKRTKPTWYSMCSRGQVPYHKSGNRLVFLKAEIDEFLKSGKHKTKSEIKDEVHSYMVNKKRKGY